MPAYKSDNKRKIGVTTAVAVVKATITTRVNVVKVVIMKLEVELVVKSSKINLI